jgi:signal transduction histidine kinase
VSSPLEAERFDAIGGVAAGAAHHLNNVLMVVLGNIQLALMHDMTPASAARLRSADRAAQDAADVVRSLTSFCHTQPYPAMTAIDLNQVVVEALDEALTKCDELGSRGPTIDVRVEHEGVLPVIGDAAALRQVLVNIVINAVEAMPAGGTLTVRTWQDETGVRCSVADTGIGMKQHVRRRAFEPFVTTKGPQTRGLGLAVAHGIVTRHGGTLVMDSEEGLGTSVVMSLTPPLPPH